MKKVEKTAAEKLRSEVRVLKTVAHLCVGLSVVGLALIFIM